MRQKKELNVQIGDQIRQARDQAGLTQEQLAEQVGVSPQYVSDLERGVVGVSIGTLKRICLCLGVSSDRLLFGTQDDGRAEFFARKCSELTPEQYDILEDIVSGYVRGIQLERKRHEKS